MMKPEFIREIWKASGGRHGFIAHRDRLRETNTWSEHAVSGYKIPSVHQRHGCDLFFSPLTFVSNVRSNDTVHKPGVLFADLDPVDPTTLSIRPSVAWETSHRSYQAIWFLNRKMDDYGDWSLLNQRMTRFTGADKGGWMGSELLRWPGSLNWKRISDRIPGAQSVPLGRLLWFEDTEYDARDMDDALPVIETDRFVDPEDMPDETLTENQYRALLRKHWDVMTLKGRSMLTQSFVPDRSLHIVRTAHELGKTLDADVVFHLIDVKEWNKWEGNPERLWVEVVRAQPE